MKEKDSLGLVLTADLLTNITFDAFRFGLHQWMEEIMKKEETSTKFHELSIEELESVSGGGIWEWCVYGGPR